MKNIPLAGSDILMHQRDTDRTERIVFPFTRYENILSAPRVVRDTDEVFGAPFVLLATDSEEMSIAEIRKLCGYVV